MASSDSKYDLSEKFRDRVRKARQRLERFIESDDQDAIHDVRTAIRRLRAAYSAIPPSVKSTSSRRYMEKWKSFFRRTSRPRDYDVIRGKLLGHGLPSDDPLVELLTELRKSQLDDLKGLAVSLFDYKRPRFNFDNGEAGSGNQRVFEMLSREFLEYLPLVLADSPERSAVHALRKAAKKLYYLQELNSDSADPEVMMHLKRVQRITGDICDSDVVIGFLDEYAAKSNFAAELQEKELSLRNKSVAEMVSFLEGVNWYSLLADRDSPSPA